MNSKKPVVTSTTPPKVKPSNVQNSSRLTPAQLESLKQLSKNRGSGLEKLLGLQPCE